MRYIGRRQRSAHRFGSVRFVSLVAAGAAASLVFASCGGNDADDTFATDTTAAGTTLSGVDGEAPEVAQATQSPVEDVPSALSVARGGVSPGLPEPVVPYVELQFGGPPPDGIPPIDEPVFLRAGEVDFLADDEPVLAIDIDGDARAYPVQVMIWHEIVNDTVGGVPVAVTYCPLCNSALAYDRRVGERLVSFGTSGMLWNSALVMYDRQTESLWSHFTGQAIAGELAGSRLEAIPHVDTFWFAWGVFRPDTSVVSGG